MNEPKEPAIVELAGEYDISTRHELQLAFQNVRENPRVIVDLTKLDYIDSTGITELMRAETRTRSIGGKLAIVCRTQRMVRLLSIAGVTARAPIMDSLESALHSMRE